MLRAERARANVQTWISGADGRGRTDGPLGLVSAAFQSDIAHRGRDPTEADLQANEH